MRRKKNAVAQREWDIEDFADSVFEVMQKQERENPAIRQIHARLTPEWERAQFLAMNIIAGTDEKRTGEMIEELAGLGETATRALIGLLVDLNKAAANERT